MFRRSRFSRFYTMLLVLALLSHSVQPVAHAQTNTPLYLPIIANGNAVPQTDLVFRTRISVQTPAQWRDLQRMEVVILDQGSDWATVLVDDLQLTDLARWRYSPTSTDTLEALVTAYAATDNATAASFQPLLTEITATKAQIQAAAPATAGVRSDLRAALQNLSEEQQSFLLAATSADTDSDGLNDTLEGYWCTDPVRADTDFDGINDGTEVQRLKDWMDNKLSKAPSSAKPFQGWPPQKTNCFDDDLDSVPDVVEVLELGLNPNRESTDRDKFDDGQELFGLTYCTGQGGYCSYGPLPRNEDWGIIFAEMPSWVKAPGHHPLVAAYPVPEVDVVVSSLRVQLVTTITDGNITLIGEERSYSTAKTEGTSTSLANTETWNEWEEFSEATEALLPQNVSTVQASNLQSSETSPKVASSTETSCSTWDRMRGKCRTFSEHELMGYDASVCWGLNRNNDTTGEVTGDSGWELGPKLTFGGSVAQTFGTSHTEKAPTDLFCKAYLGRLYKNLTPEQLEDFRHAIKVYNELDGGLGTQRVDSEEENAKRQTIVNNNFDTDEIIAGLSGIQSAYMQSGQLIANGLYDIAMTLSAPRQTRTLTQGSSRGGAQTLEHTTYEEQTVTNGQAFLNQESWSKTTALNSAHAADLWFDYKVRNIGTEYAHEICNLTFNIYIGDDPNLVYSYYVPADRSGNCFQSLDPGEEHTFTARTNTHAIPLSLEQMKAIDLGEPIRIVVEDFTYGIDERFYQDAANAGILIAIEDGTDDSDELIDTYLLPTWGEETVLHVLTRYFPHETDSTGTITAIWTPEYRSDNLGWCQSPRRPTDFPSKALWCKHAISTADWWNVYTDGLGDGSEGFQDTQAVPGSVALFRFNKDSDLDGFSDRSETQLGTDLNDASSFPRPEVLAGLHNLRSGHRVTSTLSLLNSGIYDAYGVEAVMIAADDSVSITNNTVGGSGRVRALKQVIVGSSVKLQPPLPAAWTQANHATPGVGGYYTGAQDRTYTFTVADCPAGGCVVGSGTWTLDWVDGQGGSGKLTFGANYQSPTFLPVGTLGLTLALYSGNVANGESFTVNARTPRDTFQYTINRTPYTEPLVIVSYNDPQGNHRFVLPSAAMSLTQPTANLQQYAGTMLDDVGVEIVTSRPFTVGVNSATLLVNNPSAKTLQNARLFLEVINISGTVVSEVPTQVNLPPGPTAVPVSFNTSNFNPAYRATDDYIVMAFLTDYQGNILDTAGRPLSSFQVDPLPELAADDTTLSWPIGTVTQGTLLKHALALANTGFGRLYTYIPPTSGLALNTVGSRTVGAADQPLYELTLRTADLPVGPYDQTITLATSDPAQPTRSLRVYGTITAASGDTSGGVLQRPLDFAVTVPGSHSQGEWVDFTHNLGPEPQKLHPVKVYSQDYSTLYGVGKYTTDFGQGTASYDMFGDGCDGAMPGSGNLDNNSGFGAGIVNSGSAGSNQITVTDAHAVWRINPGDAVLIHQSQGNGAGCWEMNKAISDFMGGGTFTLSKALRCDYYSDGGNNHAQILRVPQYSSCNVTGTVTPLYAWNGTSGGIFAVMCQNTMTVSGMINASGYGFRGVGHSARWNNRNGVQGEGFIGTGTEQRGQNGSGGGGGQGGQDGGGGGGGGHSSFGEEGGYSGIGNHYGGVGGNPVGNLALSTIFFGGAGGEGGADEDGGYPGSGGNGGGIVAIFSNQLNITNGIYSTGGVGGHACQTCGGGSGAGMAGGGGGAGGTIFIKGNNITLNTSSTSGGLGGQGSPGRASGGNGGAGRIRVEYCESLTGTTNPPASTQKLNCYITEQVESAPHTATRLNLPETFSNGRTYNVQFGHKLDFNAPGEQVATLHVPAGLVANSTMDVLVNNASTGDLTLKLDIGNDGSWDWESTQNVTNAATFSSPDLSAAFNQYWSSHGSPTTGNIEIPVKLWLSKGATAFVTNLQQLNLTASGSGAALDPQPLDITVIITSAHASGEWAPFTHGLGPEPQSLHPVKVYNQTYQTLWGVGNYATNFVQGVTAAKMFGDGHDGDVVVTAGQTQYDVNNTRASVVATAFANTNEVPVQGIGGFLIGDFILIHQTRGHPPVGEDAGKWEVRQITGFNPNTYANSPGILLTENLTNNYYDGGAWQAQVVKIPQYRNVTIQAGGTLTAHAWDGNTGGILAFKANAKVINNGLINASAIGFRGGIGAKYPAYAQQGEGEFGGGGYTKTANGIGGGGSYQDTMSGGGGGNATNGISTSAPGANGGQGGGIFPVPADLTKAIFGGGGGGGLANRDSSAPAGGTGGTGGGFVVISANEFLNAGTIALNGGNGVNGSGSNYVSGGGGGAGGSALVNANIILLQSGSVTALGGIAGTATGPNDTPGNGGIGRFRLEYCHTLTGTTNPPASMKKLNCYIAEQVETTPYISGNLNLPESFTDGRTYKVQFGRKLDFTAAGNQMTALRVPAGLYNSVQLDALVSGLPANATLSLDVGNDGSTEWSGAVVNNSTNVSGDLAAAFTAYWRSQNSPSGGTLDVPIKVTTTQPGQILLTNLQVSATGSRLRYVRVPVANYTSFLLDFTAGTGGTVALDLGDDGLIDWSTPLAAPRQLTENLNDELNAYLVGKSGDVDVPVRFYLAPLHPITLNDYQATVASTLDLIADSITVGSGAVTGASANSTLIDAGSTATVQATLRNNSSTSGPVTAAFFATATGWGDWYIGSAFIANIPPNGSVPVSTTWNTTGFSGTVPVKVVINPYRRVVETNYINNSKAISVTINPPPVLPAAPTGLVATMAATNRINLTWTDASNNESGFKIERSLTGVNGWTQIAMVGADVTTYASIGLACGKAYFYRVYATNSNGDSVFSNVATTLTRLCQPTLQPLTTITQTQLTLLWSDNNSNESGFKIERSLTGATPWSQIATVGANVTTYTNSGLPCGTPYYYRVRAYTGSNNSAYSAPVNATTTVCVPAAPSLLAATAISATQVNLSWQDNSSNESGFKLERSPDGVNGWALLTTVGANVTSYADSGLACATTYHYRVRATNAGGDSPNSNVTNATTPACLPDLIFADGFESSNLLAWSARAIGGGDLRSSATAALVGSQGMEAVINDNIAMYVTDQRPEAESRYRARFYFDPNTIAMTSGNAHFIFYGYQGTTPVVLRIEFRRYNGNYQLRTAALNDAPATGAATWRTTSYITISDAPHVVEVEWQAATAPETNNGTLTFWLDGVQRALLTGLDNDTRRIDLARLGPIAGIDTGTRGSYYFDAFESRRRSYIGPAGGSAAAAELLNMVETGADMAATMLNTVTLPTEGATTMTATVAGLGVQIAFPALATTEPITALLRVTDTESQPDGYSLLGEMLTVQTNMPITVPVTVTIAYGAAATGAVTTTRTLHLWNATIAQWEAIPAQVNPETQSLTATIKAPAIFALWQAETEALPAESVDENTATQETAAPSEFSIYLPLVQE